ncbi:MAG: hypothetical protein ACK5Q5_09980 [Planctomycetaceae bacterium]
MHAVELLAYLDPGAGSLLLQALVAGGAGALVFFKHMWKMLRTPAEKPTTSR